MSTLKLNSNSFSIKKLYRHTSARIELICILIIFGIPSLLGFTTAMGWTDFGLCFFVLLVAIAIMFLLEFFIAALCAPIYVLFNRSRFEKRVVEQLTYLPMNKEDYTKNQIKNITDYEIALASLFCRLPGTQNKKDSRYLTVLSALNKHSISEPSSLTPVAQNLVRSQIDASYKNALHYFENIDNCAGESVNTDDIEDAIHKYVDICYKIICEDPVWNPSDNPIIDDVEIYHIKTYLQHCVALQTMQKESIEQ